MQIRPTGKRLLVHKLEPEKQVNGLILPESKNMPYKAKILSLGDKSEIPAKAGDFLLMMPHSGFPIDEGCFMVNDHEVIGVVLNP